MQRSSASKNSSQFQLTDEQDRQLVKLIGQVEKPPLVYLTEGDTSEEGVVTLSLEGCKEMARRFGITLVEWDLQVLPLGGGNILMVGIVVAERPAAPEKGNEKGKKTRKMAGAVHRAIGCGQSLFSLQQYDRFAGQAALSVAYRNAIRQLLTPKEIADAITEFAKKGQVKVLREEAPPAPPETTTKEAEKAEKADTKPPEEKKAEVATATIVAVTESRRRELWRDIMRTASQINQAEPMKAVKQAIRSLVGENYLPDERLPELLSLLKEWSEAGAPPEGGSGNNDEELLPF
jgi:hypothetical protein